MLRFDRSTHERFSCFWDAPRRLWFRNIFIRTSKALWLSVPRCDIAVSAEGESYNQPVNVTQDLMYQLEAIKEKKKSFMSVVFPTGLLDPWRAMTSRTNLYLSAAWSFSLNVGQYQCDIITHSTHILRRLNHTFICNLKTLRHWKRREHSCYERSINRKTPLYATEQTNFNCNRPKTWMTSTCKCILRWLTTCSMNVTPTSSYFNPNDL